MPKPSLQAEYQRYYEKLSNADKRRYWIMLGQGSRADYVTIEAHLRGLADSATQIVWRELWRPDA